MDRVKRERDRFVGFVLESVETIPAADKIQGYARFIDDNTLQVDDHTQLTSQKNHCAADRDCDRFPPKLARLLE